MPNMLDRPPIWNPMKRLSSSEFSPSSGEATEGIWRKRVSLAIRLEVGSPSRSGVL